MGKKLFAQTIPEKKMEKSKEIQKNQTGLEY